MRFRSLMWLGPIALPLACAVPEGELLSAGGANAGNPGGESGLDTGGSVSAGGVLGGGTAAIAGLAGTSGGGTANSGGLSGGAGLAGAGGQGTGGAVNIGGLSIGGGAVNTGGLSVGGGIANIGGLSIGGGAVNIGGLSIGGGAVNIGGLSIGGGIANTGGLSVGGGIANTGGTASGGLANTGGVMAGGGATGTGGKATGGAPNTGGVTTTGGVPGTGGAATAGLPGSGGRATGGTPSGGTPSTGGKATGGRATGGLASGGIATGGALATGGRPGIGTACTSGTQCASTYCVDGVCCESACNTAVCQRCDASSSTGAGHCGYNIAQSDPDGECAVATTVCSGQCAVTTSSWLCSGTGYACSVHTTPGNVPSGSICASNSVVPVSKTNYCAAGNNCLTGACSASQWWTSCNGTGSCRVATDPTNAYTETVYAAPGSTLTAACGNGSSLCSTTAHCGGQTLYAGYTCDAAHACATNAQPTGCCAGACGLYGCNTATYTCNTGCAADADCAAGYCVTQVPGYQSTCQSGGMGAPCDSPPTASAPRGTDCDASHGCASSQVCKLWAGQSCTSGTITDCGDYWDAQTQAVLPLTCRDYLRGIYGQILACPSGGFCCSD